MEKMLLTAWIEANRLCIRSDSDISAPANSMYGRTPVTVRDGPLFRLWRAKGESMSYPDDTIKDASIEKWQVEHAQRRLLIGPATLSAWTI
jgi:hypothetical protein